MAAFNSYEDARRAATYARLEWPGTYYLVVRDLPGILRRHAPDGRALDFGCGTGRTTRLLRELGYEAAGVDISEEMLAEARARDPGGDYRRLPGADLGALERGAYDLVLACFTFDNIPTGESRVALLRQLRACLAPRGRLALVVSAPEIYTHEWASFSTRDFPENARAGRGGTVRIVITATDDPRPVEDVVWPDDAYQEVFAESGLAPVETCRPLGRPEDPVTWVNETRVAPWTIYVLGAGPDPR